MPVAEQSPVALLPQDDVVRLHIDDFVSFLPQFVSRQARDMPEKIPARPRAVIEALRCFHRIKALDPPENDDVLPQDVDLDAGMARDFGANGLLGPTGFPQLEPLTRDINGQRQLRADADAGRPLVSLAQFH